MKMLILHLTPNGQIGAYCATKLLNINIILKDFTFSASSDLKP